MCDFKKSAVIVFPDSAVILFVVLLATNVIITCFVSALTVTLSGTLVSDITLLFASVNTIESSVKTTLLVVFEVFVIVNSVRLPFSATLTTFSFVSDFNTPS